MKSRIRAPGGKPRHNTIHIRFNDEEYQTLINAGNIMNITPSTFVAEISMREAARLLKKNNKSD